MYFNNVNKSDQKNLSQGILNKYANNKCKCCNNSIFWYDTKFRFNIKVNINSI